MSQPNSSKVEFYQFSGVRHHTSISQHQSYPAIYRPEEGERRSGVAACWDKEDKQGASTTKTTITFTQETSRMSDFAKRKEVGRFDVGKRDEIIFLDGSVYRTADHSAQSFQEALNLFSEGK